VLTMKFAGALPPAQGRRLRAHGLRLRGGGGCAAAAATVRTTPTVISVLNGPKKALGGAFFAVIEAPCSPSTSDCQRCGPHGASIAGRLWQGGAGLCGCTFIIMIRTKTVTEIPMRFCSFRLRF
jgi:hypothetical protein